MKYEIVLFTTFPSFLFKQRRIKSRNVDGKNQYTLRRVLLYTKRNEFDKMDDEQLITGITCGAEIRNRDVISRDPERSGRIVMITIVSTAHSLSFCTETANSIKCRISEREEYCWNRRARAARYIRS